MSASRPSSAPLRSWTGSLRAPNPLLPPVAGGAAAASVYAASLAVAGAGGTTLLALAAVLAASALSSIAGFAFSAVCGAMLLHLLDGPVRIVQIMMVCSIAIQALSVWSLRRDVDWAALPPFLAGGVVGLPAGAWLLLSLPHAAYARLIGVLLVAYGACMLFRRPVTLRRDGGPVGDGIAGLVGGVTGGLAGFPGALVTVWCGMKGWDKARQRGVYQPFILIMQVLGLGVIHAMAPAAGTGAGLDAAAFVPAALLGTCCGLAVFRRLSDRQFAAAVNLLLIASGLALAL